MAGRVVTMRRVAVAMALAACWGAALACGTSFHDDPTQTAPEAGESDASTDSAVVVPVDAAIPPVDGSHFCATVDASFCADFDVGALLGQFTVVQTEAGTLSQTSDAESPPNAVLSTTDPTGNPLDAAGAVTSAAALIKNLARPLGSVGAALDMDVRLDSLPVPDAGFAILSSVGFVSDTQLVQLAAGDGWALVLNDPSVPAGSVTPVMAPVKIGWVHIRLEVGFDSQSTNVFVDHVFAGTGPGLANPGGSGFFISVGVAAQSNNRVSVAYDNVVVTSLF